MIRDQVTKEQPKIVREIEKEWEEEKSEEYKKGMKTVVGGIKNKIENLGIKIEEVTEDRDEAMGELGKIRTGKRNLLKELQRKKA